MVTYSKEEKQAIMEEYKTSGKSLGEYTEEKRIPSSTLQGWLKEDKNLTFGAIEINTAIQGLPKTIKPATVFATENMRIELKEGFDKKLLRAIVEVLLHD